MPWAPTGTLSYETVADVRVPRPDACAVRAEDRNPLQRQTTITVKELAKTGWTEGCPKCRALAAKDKSKTSASYSRACRARVAEMLRDDEEFKARVRLAMRRKQITPVQDNGEEEVDLEEEVEDVEMEIPDWDAGAWEQQRETEERQRKEEVER